MENNTIIISLSSSTIYQTTISNQRKHQQQSIRTTTIKKQKQKQKQKTNTHQSSSLYRIVTEGTCCAILCGKPTTSTNINIRHTTTNNNKNIIEYKLQPDDGEEYNTTLHLLQNNIIALCICTGVPAQSQFPAETMLLNINALIRFCEEQLQQKPCNSNELTKFMKTLSHQNILIIRISIKLVHNLNSTLQLC